MLPAARAGLRTASVWCKGVASLFAFGTAVSMAALSAGFGRALSLDWITRFAPALAAVSLVFGLWYAAVALGLEKG